MKTAIISIGTELLFGNVVNTNAAFLSEELNEMGMDVLYHYTIGDNPRRLARVLDLAAEDCDLILCTGGLGPTDDDLTKQTVCDHLGLNLVYNEEADVRMQKRFGRVVPESENNRKQVFVPEAAEIFYNECGTAPGFAAVSDGVTVICMPGVPAEMKTMWHRYVRPYLLQFENAHIVSRRVELFGMGESVAEMELLDLIRSQTDPTIATYAKEGTVEIRVTSKHEKEEEATRRVDEMTEQILKYVGSHVFSTRGESIETAAARRLTEQGVSISCAEEVTAGFFASRLADQAGFATFFDRGFIIPDAGTAEEEGLLPRTFCSRIPLQSSDAAEEMVRRLREKTGSRMCIAVTGGMECDERGLVEHNRFYVSILFDGKMYTGTYSRRGWSEQQTRVFMAQTVMDRIIYLLEGRDFPAFTALQPFRNEFREE